jgi:eukaryotic-like serine/threonine-protein kinase
MTIDKILRKRYKILESLGSGAFGDTYLAEDLDLPNKPKCVVKHLKPKATQPEILTVARRLFENEAATLYRLGNLSTQIPKLFAHFEENGEFYLVQEFIDGYDLSAEIIPGNRWHETRVVQLLQEILEVLVFVHEQNIIHRDIKPQNLMRRRADRKIVMIDFGAVKEIKSLAFDTQGQVTSTIVIGSNGYMPNEQANSKPKLASDIYAVGVIGIQALTGKSPHNFEEDFTNGEILWRKDADVSNKLADVLTKMVRYNFSQRYQTADEALQALLDCYRVKPDTIPPGKSLFTPKTLFGIGAGILAIFAVIFFIPRARETKEEFTELPCGSEISITDLPTTPTKKFEDGNEYYGDLNNKGDLNGKGTMVFNNGNRYDGEFKNGLRNGCGKFSYGEGYSVKYYIGEYVNDKYHGLGKIKWKDGSEYRGNFKEDKCDGQGILQLADGSIKSGIWQNGDLLGSNITCNR